MMSDSMIHHQVSLQVPSLYPELGEGLCKAGGEIEDEEAHRSLDF